MSRLLLVASLVVVAVSADTTLKLSGKCPKKNNDTCEGCASTETYNATGSCVLKGQTSYIATCTEEKYTLKKYTDAACKEGEQTISKSMGCEAQLYRSGSITVNGTSKNIDVQLCDESSEAKCADTSACTALAFPTNNETCQLESTNTYKYRGNTTTDDKAYLYVYDKDSDCTGTPIFAVEDKAAGCYSTVTYEKSECEIPTAEPATTMGVTLPVVFGAAVATVAAMLAF